MWFRVKAIDSSVFSLALGFSSHSQTTILCHPISASFCCSSLSRSLFRRILFTQNSRFVFGILQQAESARSPFFTLNSSLLTCDSVTLLKEGVEENVLKQGLPQPTSDNNPTVHAPFTSVNTQLLVRLMCSGLVVVLLNQPTKDVYDIIFLNFRLQSYEKISLLQREERYICKKRLRRAFLSIILYFLLLCMSGFQSF